ncbi:MAG: Gfo/Idh/MocA family oxidoreductase [Lentisphaeria bacterium]|nr:Gfo/Idh/MocA family oxidoreductase [Lentisphaeria bacterium]
MKKYRIAVVGLGMGRRHIAGFRAHPAAEVVAVSDVNPELLERVRREESIPAAYPEWREMIGREKPDILVVAVPNFLHRELTVTGLRAGCHVFCEKPMALNAAEGGEMLRVAEETGRRLGINFRFRFAPQSVAMKKLVDAGMLGEIYYGRTEWMRRRRLPGFGGWFGRKELSGGGPLIDLGVHRLDLALWLMGYPEPEWVMGATDNRIAAPLAAVEGKTFDVEDIAAGFIRFRNGATLEVGASWAGHIRQREQVSTRILGTAGGLHQYNVGDHYDFEVELYHEINGVPLDSKLHLPVPECHESSYSFLDALVKEAPFCVDPREGVMVMRILDALYESAARNEPVKLTQADTRAVRFPTR